MPWNWANSAVSQRPSCKAMIGETVVLEQTSLGLPSYCHAIPAEKRCWTMLSTVQHVSHWKSGVLMSLPLSATRSSPVWGLPAAVPPPAQRDA